MSRKLYLAKDEDEDRMTYLFAERPEVTQDGIFVPVKWDEDKYLRADELSGLVEAGQCIELIVGDPVECNPESPV